MFNFLKRKTDKSEVNKKYQNGDVLSPVDGKAASIEKSSDQVFSSRAMGDGIVIQPESGNLYSPVSGEITMIANTKHALTIRSNDGVDILLHFGIDTVNLSGKPFNISIRKGDQVRAGAKIGSMDLDQIISAGLSTEVILVFIKSDNKDVSLNISDNVSHHGDVIGKYTVRIK